MPILLGVVSCFVLSGFAALLYHEYMHVLVHFLANRLAPVWLNEGLAEMAGRRFYVPEIRPEQNVDATSRLDWRVLTGSFASLDPSKIPLAYAQSHSLTAFMVENYGWFKMTELLKLLGTRVDWQEAINITYED